METIGGIRPEIYERWVSSVSRHNNYFTLAVLFIMISGHAPVPDFEGFTSAPLGVELDSQEKLLQHANRVFQTVVVTRTMPLANLTRITDSERQQIARWFNSRGNSAVNH